MEGYEWNEEIKTMKNRNDLVKNENKESSKTIKKMREKIVEWSYEEEVCKESEKWTMTKT